MTDNRIEQVKKIITDLCDGCEVDGVSTGLIEIASKEIVSALYSEPQVCPKPEQMMICPKAKECGEECFYPDHQIPHADNWGCTKPHNSNGCPACIPVPSTPASDHIGDGDKMETPERGNALKINLEITPLPY